MDTPNVVDAPKTENVAPAPETVKEPDLVTRVAQFKKEPITEPVSQSKEFDVNEINKIEDPAAREYALKAYKSFEKGFGQKFQEVAQIRKELEKQRNETSNWTPERIQGLLKDPNFVKAAQAVTGTPEQTEDYSALSERERAKISQLEQEVAQMRSQSIQSFKTQEDMELKTKYADYNPEAVDTLTADLLAGKVQAKREHLWWILNRENEIKKAYELGKQDRQQENQEKVSGMSMPGINTTPTTEKPEPMKGESDRDFFRRIALNNLLKLKNIKK